MKLVRALMILFFIPSLLLAHPDISALMAEYKGAESCVMCHGDDQAGTKMASDSHTAHIDASTLFGVSVSCDRCHPPIADPAHMDSSVTVEVSKNSVTTTVADPTSLNGCGTNDCHEDGVPDGCDVRPGSAWEGADLGQPSRRAGRRLRCGRARGPRERHANE